MENRINEKNLLIILGDSKPIYYLSEILIVHYHNYIERILSGTSSSISHDIYLPIIQIAESKILDDHKICDIKENNCIINVRSVPGFEYIVDIIQRFSRHAPHIETNIIRQLLKIGTMDVFFRYFYIRRNPSSYETVELLLRSIMEMSKEKSDTIFNVFILVFTREPESTYNAYAELMNVLRSSKLGVNNSNIRIKLVETGLVGSEEEFLRRHHKEFINQLFSQVHPYSYVSPQIPIYDHASELIISYARSLARSEFKIYDNEEGGGIYHICTPNTPLTLLATLHYLLNQNKKNRIYYNCTQNSTGNGSKNICDNSTGYVLIPDIIFSTFHRCPRYRLSIGHKRGDNWSVNYIFRGIIVFRKFKKIGEYSSCNESNNEYIYTISIPGRAENNDSENCNIIKDCPNRRICIISLVESSLQKSKCSQKNDIFSKHYTCYEISSIKPLIKINDKKWILYVKSEREEKCIELEDTGERYPAFIWACIRGFDNWRDKPGHGIKDPLLTLIESIYPLYRDEANSSNCSSNSKYVLSLEMHGCLSTTRSYNRIALVSIRNNSENHNKSNRKHLLNRLLIIPINERHFNVVKEYVESVIYDNINWESGNYRISDDESKILIYKEMFSCDEIRCPLLKYKPYILITDITYNRLPDQLRKRMFSNSILLIAQVKELLKIEKTNNKVKLGTRNNQKGITPKKTMFIINKIAFKAKINYDELISLLNNIEMTIIDSDDINRCPINALIKKTNIDPKALLEFINADSKRIFSPFVFNFINNEITKVEKKINGIIEILDEIKSIINDIENDILDIPDSIRKDLKNELNEINRLLKQNSFDEDSLIDLLVKLNEITRKVKIKINKLLGKIEDSNDKIPRSLLEDIKYIIAGLDYIISASYEILTNIDEKFYYFLERIAEFLQVMVYKEYPADNRLDRIRIAYLHEL